MTKDHAQAQDQQGFEPACMFRWRVGRPREDEHERRHQHHAQRITGPPLKQLARITLYGQIAQQGGHADPHKSADRRRQQGSPGDQLAEVAELGQVWIEPAVALKQPVPQQRGAGCAQGGDQRDRPWSAVQRDGDEGAQRRAPGIARPTEHQRGQGPAAGRPEDAHDAVQRKMELRHTAQDHVHQGAPDQAHGVGTGGGAQPLQAGAGGWTAHG